MEAGRWTLEGGGGASSTVLALTQSNGQVLRFDVNMSHTDVVCYF